MKIIKGMQNIKQIIKLKGLILYLDLIGFSIMVYLQDYNYLELKLKNHHLLMNLKKFGNARALVNQIMRVI